MVEDKTDKKANLSLATFPLGKGSSVSLVRYAKKS